MLARLRSGLTYANVMATVAVFIALGGGAYAALKLPAKSVGTRELKDKAVTPRKVAPKTIDLFKGKKGDPGLKGDAGAQGPQGIQGIQGIDGPPGPSNAFFNHAYGPTAAVSVPAGDYAIYGQALFVASGMAGQGSCFLYANGAALDSDHTNSGLVVQVPTTGGTQTSDTGVAHLATAGTISNQCSPTGGASTTNNAVLATKLGSAAP